MPKLIPKVHAVFWMARLVSMIVVDVLPSKTQISVIIYVKIKQKLHDIWVKNKNQSNKVKFSHVIPWEK